MKYCVMLWSIPIGLRKYRPPCDLRDAVENAIALRMIAKRFGFDAEVRIGVVAASEKE